MTADPHHEHEECEPVTVRSGPEPIDVIETALLRLLEDGHDPRDIAILSRTNRMLDTASAVCLNMDLPFQRIARRRDAEDTDPAFAASLAALQLVVNPYDHNAFRRVCEWCGIPEATIAEALEAALVESTEAVSELLERTKAISVADNAQDLLRWVGNCHPDEEFGTAAWMALLAAFGDEVASAWEAMGYRTPQTALRGYMMRDRDLVDELDGEGVTLATIHAAKGLEWPAVIVIGMDEGHFPRKGCDDAALIEERCCAYVAMTRARRKLVLLSCGEVPSRFIREALP